MGSVTSTTNETSALPNPKPGQTYSDSLASAVPRDSTTVDFFSNAREVSINGSIFNIVHGSMTTRELHRVAPSVSGDCSERNEQSHEDHFMVGPSQSQLLDRDNIPPSEIVASHTDCRPHSLIHTSSSITRSDLDSRAATSGRLRDQPTDYLPTSIHRSPPLERVDERCDVTQSRLNRQDTQTLSRFPESSLPLANPPTETDSERYARLLLPKRHGYPLWDPAPPYTGPPPDHITNGVMIGDVGVLNNDGGFNFLFNVCHTADHPLNRNGVPAGFDPFPQTIDVFVRPGSFSGDFYEKSSEITYTERRVHNSLTNVQWKMTFTTTNLSEGAILVFPTGATRIDAQRIGGLRKYAMRNAISWYSYINVQREWEVPNNALYLVTGCDKCTNWAVASFRRRTMERSVPSLELLVTSEGGSQSENMRSSWVGSSTAACRTGPRIVQTGGDNITHARQPNQCVFLRGFKIAIYMDKINRSSDKSVVLTSAVDSPPDNVLSKGTDIPFGFGQNGLSGSDVGSGTGSHSGSSSNSSTDSREGDTRSHGDLDDASGTSFSIQFIPERRQLYHPSDIINRFLLSQNENVKVAITHDDEWCAAFDPLAACIPGDDQLLESIFSKYSATITPEGSFLEPKSTSSNARDSAGTPSDALAMLSEVVSLDVVPSTSPGPMTTRELLRVPPSVSGDCSERNERSREDYPSMMESPSQSQLLDHDDISPFEIVASRTDCQPHNLEHTSTSITRSDLDSRAATSGRLHGQPPGRLSTSIHQSPSLEHVDERCEEIECTEPIASHPPSGYLSSDFNALFSSTTTTHNVDMESTKVLLNAIERLVHQIESDVKQGPLIGLDDLPAYLNAIEHPNSVNDRLLLLQKALVLMSRLGDNEASPEHKKIASDLQGFVIDLLYKDLSHPPNGYLSLASSSSATNATSIAPTASVPGTYVKYAYRSADGSNYNPLLPTMGKAGAPYARSVRSTHFANLKSLPDPGLVFDTLLRRPKTGGPDNDGFIPHPSGASSLFFAFADLIIHSVFNTNQKDITINDTSSYLDLSILYGNNQAQVDSVRRKDGTGMLWEDVFADNRLLLMPPATCALLVLFCRNHNYVAQKIFAINEWGTFKDPASLASQPDKLAAQDDEIFNRARLVNSGYFVQVILGDYVGAILGQVRDGRTWRLDPRTEIRRLDHAFVPRGEGNVVSIEFNLLYRWHATLSKHDTKWTEEMFRSALKGIGKGDLPFDQLDTQTFFAAAGKALTQTGNVKTWTFGGLTRSADTNRFSDSDLAKILQDATSYSAAAFGARGIPEVLRVIEVLGIEQARGWGACSLNEFRKFIGLEPYNTFEEWNPDREIAAAARSLYHHIDNLELHVGMQAEATKSPGPGAGLCPGSTISSAILADAVILTRGDRFLTTDFTPFNLTTWGYLDCQYPTVLHPNQANPDGSYGGMLTKLLLRHLPTYYPARSTYAHFPFLVPEYMKGQMKQRLGDVGIQQYSWSRPTVPIGLAGSTGEGLVIKSYEGAWGVLENTATKTKTQGALWESGYTQRLATIVGQRDKKIPQLSMDLTETLINEKNSYWAEYFAKTTKALVEERSIKHVGSSQGIKYVDIVRDVIKALPVRWICDELAGLPLSSKDGYSEEEYVKMMEDVCRYVDLNVTPEDDWQLREDSVRLFRFFEKCVAGRLNTFSSFIANIASQILHTSPGHSTEFLKTLHEKGAGKSHPELAAALFCEVVPTAAHWAKSVAQVVEHYLGDGDALKAEREEIIKLGKEGKAMGEGGKKRIVELIRKVLIADPPVSGTYRTALQDTIIPGPGGKRVEAREKVFVSIVDANKNRPKDAPGILGIGEDGLLSAKFFEAITPIVLATILSLPNLQRAPGESGIFNKFTENIIGAPEEVFIDAYGGLSPFPASLIVSYTTA